MDQDLNNPTTNQTNQPNFTGATTQPSATQSSISQPSSTQSALSQSEAPLQSNSIPEPTITSGESNLTTLNELDNLSVELSNYTPEDDQVTSLTPSSNLEPAATVSASQAVSSEQSSNVDPTDITSMQDPVASVSTTDSNAQPSITAEEHIETENPDTPLKPSEPVPGSIGSAKSYVDPDIAPVEKPKKKLSSTAILVIILGITLIVGGIVVALMVLK